MDPDRSTPIAGCLAQLAILVVLLGLSPSRSEANGYLDLGEAGEECTIAVLSGAATSDGRPIIWKNRDTGVLDSEVVYFEDGAHAYTALVNAGESHRAWIGVNDKGFAILNALSYNIADSIAYGITNGELMKKALQSCATIDDFEQLLAETNVPGRQNPANLAVLDAINAPAIFEVGNRHWRRFDSDDPKVAPEGFLVRANFSLSADTSGIDTYRYHRCRSLLAEGVDGGGIDSRTIITRVARDIRSAKTDPYPLPFEGSPPDYPKAVGYVETSNTINRRSTAAAGLIQGIRDGEDPRLSTFFAILGQPVVTIALPVWVAAGPTPPELDGPKRSPLCDLARDRKSSLYDYPYNGALLNTYRLYSSDRTSLLALVERVDRWIFPIVEDQMRTWRHDGLDPTQMAEFQSRVASEGFSAYKGGPLPVQAVPVSVVAHPNPTRGTTLIRYQGEAVPPSNRSIDIFDLSGRLIRRLHVAAGDRKTGQIDWDGRDASGRPVVAGVYFLRPSWGDLPQGGRLVILR